MNESDKLYYFYDSDPSYCPVCHYPYNEDGNCMCASTCPCGCNNDPRLICTYDQDDDTVDLLCPGCDSVMVKGE